MAILGPDLSALTERGIIGTFYRRYEEQMAGSWAARVCQQVVSDQETEKYRLLGMVPQFREWKGTREQKDLRTDSFTIDNVVYELSVPFDAEDFRRDKTGQIAARLNDVSRRAADHPELLATTVIEANPTTYDGQALFSASHALGSSGTQSNLLTASDVAALNVATPAAPTPDEFADLLVGVMQQAYTFKDDRGEPINGGARTWGLMVSPNHMGAAFAAVNGELRNSGSTSITSTLPTGIAFDIIVNPRLTSTDVIYLFREDVESRALIWQEEVSPQVELLTVGSEHTTKTNQVLLAAKAVRAVGPGEPLVALKATLS